MRRSKNPSAMHHDAVYQYRIRAMIDSEIKELRICKKAFMAIHGITKKKVEYLLSSLKSTGIAPTDKRGRHGHQPKLCSETKSSTGDNSRSMHLIYLYLIQRRAYFISILKPKERKAVMMCVLENDEHFIYNFMTKTTKHLRIFCDSCSGQNKNFTMFRFLYLLVHVEKKLDSVTMTFPVRGHSYLENDNGTYKI